LVEGGINNSTDRSLNGAGGWSTLYSNSPAKKLVIANGNSPSVKSNG
jgi:hypothetical protein